MNQENLKTFRAEIERKLGHKLKDGQFGLLLGYAKRSGSTNEAGSRLWELRKRKYLPSRIAGRVDELRGMTVAQLEKLK